MVRHADVHNPKDIIYGRLPRFGLSTVGREQATQLATYLSSLPVAALYSSPQLRARQTARIIQAQLDCDRIHISTLIAEVLTGYQGSSNSILGDKFNFYDKLARSSDESIALVAARMVRFVERVRRRHSGEIVVAVSHADPIMILRAAVLGLPLVIDSLRGKYYPAKCSVTELAFPGDAPRPVVIYRAPVKDETTKAGSNRKAAVTSDLAEGDGHWRSRASKVATES